MPPAWIEMVVAAECWMLTVSKDLRVFSRSVMWVCDHHTLETVEIDFDSVEWCKLRGHKAFGNKCTVEHADAQRAEKRVETWWQNQSSSTRDNIIFISLYFRRCFNLKTLQKKGHIFLWIHSEWAQKIIYYPLINYYYYPRLESRRTRRLLRNRSQPSLMQRPPSPSRHYRFSFSIQIYHFSNYFFSRFVFVFCGSERAFVSCKNAVCNTFISASIFRHFNSFFSRSVHFTSGLASTALSLILWPLCLSFASEEI